MLRTFIFFMSIIVCHSSQAVCESGRVSLTVLGSGGPELNDGRNSSGYLVWIDNKSRLLIDAGPGTSTEFGLAKGKLEDIDGVLLTHLHVDHSADLPAFIKGSFFTSRSNELLVLGPDKNQAMPATTEFVERLFSDHGAFQYLSSYYESHEKEDYKIKARNVALNKGQKFVHRFSDTLKVLATTVYHGPIAAVAWRVEALGCSIVFSGDMNNDYDMLGQFAHKANLLVANNAIPESAGGVAKNLHMTPSEIAKIAKQAQPKQLMLSHFMNRTLQSQQTTIDLITEKYQGPIILAEDGMKVSIR